jgi:hypothetical protein
MSYMSTDSRDGLAFERRDNDKGNNVQQYVHVEITETVRYCEFSGSHGGEYEDGCLLGCCAVKSGRSSPTFQRCLLCPSSGL